ncbi:MAG: NUDIX hydrolase [Candidatus Baltobacteraceae bacterium]
MTFGPAFAQGQGLPYKNQSRMKAYRRLAKREVYRNPYLCVEVHDVVHPNGSEGEYALLVAPPASAAIVSDGGDLLFARQPRFGAQAEVIEIVKGGRDQRESALDCAKREAREELGIQAAHWEPLGILYEIPSIVNAPVELFLAHGIEHVESQEDALESVDLVRVPEDAAIKAAVSGQINDAVTVAALLRYGLRRGRLRFSAP